MTEREKMIAGEFYVPSDPELLEARMRARRLCKQYNQSEADDWEGRDALIRQLFGSAGKEPYLEADFRCDYGANIHVGDYFYANFNCVILDCAPVTIGNNCMLAPMVGIYTATHPLDAKQRSSGKEYAKAITIGDDVWIGAQSVINPGVTIGNRVVVASGSVVTRDVPDDVVVAGNPAMILRHL